MLGFKDVCVFKTGSLTKVKLFRFFKLKNINNIAPVNVNSKYRWFKSNKKGGLYASLKWDNLLINVKIFCTNNESDATVHRFITAESLRKQYGISNCKARAHVRMYAHTHTRTNTYTPTVRGMGRSILKMLGYESWELWIKLTRKTFTWK